MAFVCLLCPAVLCSERQICVEGVSLERSLSVFLPVHNGQSGLEANVSGILEVLPELARRFELLIIDDGSTDATAEVAYELSLRYPQVSFVRHPLAFGLPESIQTGLDATRGEVVIVHDGHSSVDPLEIAKLVRCDNAEPLSRPMVERKEGWLGKLLTWLRTPRQKSQISSSPGFYLLRRDAVHQARRSPTVKGVARTNGEFRIHDGRARKAADHATTPHRWCGAVGADVDADRAASASRQRVAERLKRFTS